MDGKKAKVLNELSIVCEAKHFMTGLGKTSQGISTALSVEKTSRRGGKIVNAAAGIGWFYVFNMHGSHDFTLQKNRWNKIKRKYSPWPK